MGTSTDFLSSGDTYHCIELNSGKNQTGVFECNSGGYSVRFVSYDGKPAFGFSGYRDKEVPGYLYLRTERNRVITLIDSIRGGASRFPYSSGSEEILESITFRSSVALVGNEKWRPTDHVQQVSFTVDGTMEMLESRDHWRSMHKFLEGEGSLDHLFKMNMPDYKLTVWYGGTTKGFSDRLEDPHPMFTLEFKSPIEVSKYIGYVTDISSFLSFSLGRPLTPSRIRLDKLTTKEIELALEERKPLGQCAANYTWRLDENTGVERTSGLMLVDCYDSEALEIFKGSLREWIERSNNWKKSYAHMMGCLWYRNEYSADRVLAACRWLEDIPGAEPLGKIATAELDAIIDGTLSIAREIGVTRIDDRIKGALKRIGLESHKERFERLSLEVQLDAISPVRREKFVGDLVHSQKVRGTAAHTLLRPKDEDKQMQVYDAIEAVEALCFLLTIRGWPKAETSFNRLGEHHFLRYYRLSNRRNATA